MGQQAHSAQYGLPSNAITTIIYVLDNNEEIILYFNFFFLDTTSPYFAQAGLELTILPLLSLVSS